SRYGPCRAGVPCSRGRLEPYSSACREGAFVLHLGMVRYLTGFQPTGSLHIGNYFGALRPAIELQNKGEAFYFIADFHALTTIHNPETLRKLVRGVAIDSLACGLDPQKACFFR